MIEGCSDLGEKKLNSWLWTGCHLGCKIPLSAFIAEFCLLLLYSDFLLDFFSFMLLYAAKEFLSVSQTQTISPAQEQSYSGHRRNMDKIPFCPPPLPPLFILVLWGMAQILAKLIKQLCWKKWDHLLYILVKFSVLVSFCYIVICCVSQINSLPASKYVVWIHRSFCCCSGKQSFSKAL